MKKLLVAFVLFSTAKLTAEVDHRQNFVKAGECYIQASSQKRLERALQTEKDKKAIVGQVKDILFGELDPVVLGDGGLILIESRGTSHLIFESDELALIASQIRNNKDQKLNHVALFESCLEPVRSKRRRTEMQALASQFMGGRPPFTFWELY